MIIPPKKLREQIENGQHAIGGERMALPTATVLALLDDIDRQTQELDLALGPHCDSCGNPIDPEWCHCGSAVADHGAGDGHAPVPMGCVCGYVDEDYKRLAKSRGERLWQLRRERDGWRTAFEVAEDNARRNAESLAKLDEVLDKNEELRARLAGAEAANAAIEIVEHTELNGHIEIAEQLHDHLVHEASDDPSGKLRDFVESLRIVIDQLDRTRRQRNWFEATHEATKQKLVESAVAKQTEDLAKARDEACDLVSDCLDRMTALVDEHGDSVVKEPGYIATENKLAELRKVGAK